MIDFTRLNTANAQLNNAANLSAMSVLANYDNLLLEAYGLMGTSQNRTDTIDFGRGVVSSSLGGSGFNLFNRGTVQVTMGPSDDTFTLNHIPYFRQQVSAYMRYRVALGLLDEQLIQALEEAEGSDLDGLNQDTAENQEEFAKETFPEFAQGLDDLHTYYYDLIEKVNEIEEAFGEARDELNELLGELSDLRASLQASRSERQSLQNGRAAAQGELSALQAQLSSLQDQYNNVGSCYCSEDNDYDCGNCSTKSSLSSQMSSVNAQITPVNNRITTYNAEIAVLDGVIAGLESDIAAGEAEVEDILDKLKELLDEAQELADDAEQAGDAKRDALEQMLKDLQAGRPAPAGSGKYTNLFVDLMTEELIRIRDGCTEDETPTAFVQPNLTTAGNNFKDQNLALIMAITPNSLPPINLNLVPFCTDKWEQLHEVIEVDYCEDKQDEINNAISEMEKEQEEEDEPDPSNNNLLNENGRPILGNFPPIPDAYMRAPHGIRPVRHTDRNNEAVNAGLDNSFLDGALDRLLLTEYGIQMFSHFLTNRSFGFGEGIDDDVFEVMLSGIPLHVENGLSYWFGAELEFLFWGNASAQSNFTATRNTLSAIFFARNYMFTFKCQILRREIAVIRAIPKVGWVLAEAYRLAMAGLETYFDIQRLIETGQRVPLIKTPQTSPNSPNHEWQSGLRYFEIYQTNRTIWQDTVSGDPIEGRGLFYYQYLRLLIMLNSPSVIAMRLATLIEVNMNYHLSLQKGSGTLPDTPKHFKLSNAYVLAESTVTATVPHMFIQMPFIGGSDGSQFTVSVTRGY